MTFIFAHGLGQAPSSWDGVLSELPAGMPAHLPRLFGEGRESYGGLYAGFSADCARCGEPLQLCGVSLGAVLALNYALDNPRRVKSLVLIAPQYRTPRLLLGVQSAVFRLMPASAFSSTGLSKREMTALTASMGDLDFTPRLHELACPVHIVCGGRDKANLRAARRLSGLVPGARLRIVEGAGHEVNMDAPELLADILKQAWRAELGSFAQGRENG